MKKFNHALVLGGGSSFGIGWELGYLAGLASAGFDLEQFDYILGTSAGSHVGALVASKKKWQDIYTEYIENRQEEQRPEIDSLAVFGRYAAIAKEAKTPEQWVDLQTDYAKETDTCHYTVHLANVEKKYGKLNWGKSLHITTVDVETNERIVWDNQSGVTLSQAICASSSLPGLWPPIEINNQLYCDGGLYSMENADFFRKANRTTRSKKITS